MSEELNPKIQEAQDKKNIEPQNDKDVNQIEELTNQIQNEKDRYVRLFAEFDNYKKRTSKERIEVFKRSNQELILSLLPVLDDFGRALREIERQEDDELFKGIDLIRQKLNETLAAKGLKKIDVNIGDDFNTDIHEAITQIPAPEENLVNKVVDITEVGYSLNDNPIRYAKVVVGT